YLSYRIPKDALPGRYEVHTEAIVDGMRHESGTKNWDHFFVDSIELKKLVRSGRRSKVIIENHSSMTTPIKLWEPQGKNFHRRMIDLSPRSLTEVPLNTNKAFVSYVYDNEILKISEGNEPFVQRNLQFQYSDNASKRETCLFPLDSSKS